MNLTLRIVFTLVSAMAACSSTNAPADVARSGAESLETPPSSCWKIIDGLRSTPASMCPEMSWEVTPADELMWHQDNVLTILEANKSELDQAASKITNYIANHRPAMRAAMQKLLALAEELRADPAKAAEMMALHNARMEAMQRRMEAIEAATPGLRDHPGIKAAMAAISTSLD